MGREIRRVPLDFDHPLNKVWGGFLLPEALHEARCEPCDGSGYSAEANALKNLWYGYRPFNPASTGSSPLTPATPEVRAAAERNVERAPDYYGTGEHAIVREATRLADMWNGQWCHHLDQADVDALIAAGRLYDFTHTWTKGEGWKPIDPQPTVTADQVNRWSLGGLSHDSINASIAIRARCKRNHVPDTCPTCEGHGQTERYPGQRAEADAWTATEPPTGDGWQLWETVSEGSPISPVFPTKRAFAEWLCSPANSWGISTPMPSIEQATRFIDAAWAPTMIATDTLGVVAGETYVAATHSEGDGQ